VRFVLTLMFALATLPLARQAAAQTAISSFGPTTPAAGTAFRDCPDCPEMVAISPGEFFMGSPADDEERSGGDDEEGPVHRVKIARPFAAGKFDVTFAEWDACVAGGGCNGYRPHDGPASPIDAADQNPYLCNGDRKESAPKQARWGRGTRPVINVSWNDAQTYLRWLSRKTGKSYRLLSEAEWEYAARAGTTTRYYWGDEVGRGNANCDGCGSQWAAKQTAPVGSFRPNPLGLHDMAGNVWQWVEDCTHDTYNDVPTDGSAASRITACKRLARGGSWRSCPRDLRSASRSGLTPGYRDLSLGFRLARTLP